MEPLVFERMIAAARDEVWLALTTAAGLTSWLCRRARVEPVVGGAFELYWNPDETRPESDSTIGCRVLAVDPPRLLTFTWRGADEVADVMHAVGAPVTQVTVELRPRPTGTRLLLTHAGWGAGPGWDRARAWFARAWEDALARLEERFAAL
jgi:uncharacterized protein YndB with AHSA1/START domain